MQWDVFCRVIDNFGDIGVCWRLAADLAVRGETVRLWVDDASALAWMAPQGAPGVSVEPWTAEPADRAPGNAVVEAFGCDPPARFIERLAQAARPPVWINLEYLSAESYVVRSHGLPSPRMSEPGVGLTKWFFYPGFTPGTGGLLREPGLIAGLDAFNRDEWLVSHGITALPRERLVSLFCYDNPALPAMLEALGDAPTLLLVTPGAAARQVAEALGPGMRCGTLRAHALPYLTQTAYDRLLRCCDLNLVRGEDSFVRAQWAGRPFVWQIYPQADEAHAAKLQAFLDLFLAGAPSPLQPALRALWLGWNSLAPLPSILPSAGTWAAHCRHWREQLLKPPDLATQLLSFVNEKR